VIGADVLRNAARFARCDFRTADIVEQRGLAVIDVTHDGHHRGTWQLLGVGMFFAAGGKQCFRIIQFCGVRGVAHFLDQNHRGLLV
jgi:hypothetical protein